MRAVLFVLAATLAMAVAQDVSPRPTAPRSRRGASSRGAAAKRRAAAAAPLSQRHAGPPQPQPRGHRARSRSGKRPVREPDRASGRVIAAGAPVACCPRRLAIFFPSVRPPQAPAPPAPQAETPAADVQAPAGDAAQDAAPDAAPAATEEGVSPWQPGWLGGSFRLRPRAAAPLPERRASESNPGGP